MTEAFIETPEEPAGSSLQILAAILLGIAATLTALSAYFAAISDGNALQGYTKASQSLTDSNFFYQQGNQVQAGDQQLFVAYAEAAQNGDADLSEYLKTLMRPEMVDALAWWESTDEAVTPFDAADDNPYVISDYDEGERLSGESKDQFSDASAEDNKGDKFEMATVLLALTLFFGGIATLFARRAVTVGMLGVAAVTLVAGALRFATAL